MSSAKNVLVLKHFEAPKKPGVHFRLLCMTGKNKGESYFLTGGRIVIGRSEKADIQVFDTKSSREHAEVTKVGNNFVITDLKSQNGMMVNDNKVTQQTLKDGDKVIIGQTVFRFGKIDVNNAEEKPTNKQEETFPDETPKEPPKNNSKLKFIFILLALAFVFILMDEPAPTDKQGSKINIKVNEFNDDYSSDIKKKQLAEDKELKEKLDGIFHRGLREVREGNYFRAINEFNLALILSPNNGRASYYRSKTIQMLDESIQEHFVAAKRAANGLKYRSAANSYCAIIRLLQNTPEDQRYKDAVANIKEIEQNLGLNTGEINCIQQ